MLVALYAANSLLDEIKITRVTATISFHIYKPNSLTLVEYNGGLESAILRYSKLLNDDRSMASSKGCY